MTDRARILVVEDDMPVAMLMVSLLTRADCEVEAAHGANKALGVARQKPFDLIALDIDLPGITGIELFRRLRQISHLKTTPIVFVSGRHCAKEKQIAYQLDAVDFIEKPIDAIDFISLIFTHLGKEKARPGVFGQPCLASTTWMRTK